MKTIIKVLLVIIAVLLLIAISAGVFIGAGYGLSLLLPLTLFQSSLLCIGATFVFAFIIFAGLLGVQLFEHDAAEEEDEEEEEEEEEDDDDDEDDDDFEDDEMEYKKSNNAVDRSFRTLELNRVGRNAACPCGSGKKYKNCCGKKHGNYR